MKQKNPFSEFKTGPMIAEIISRMEASCSKTFRERFMTNLLQEWMEPMIEMVAEGNLEPSELRLLCARSLQVAYDHLRLGHPETKAQNICEAMRYLKERHHSIYEDL